MELKCSLVSSVEKLLRKAKMPEPMWRVFMWLEFKLTVAFALKYSRTKNPLKPISELNMD
jgi:hypothetical protein